MKQKELAFWLKFILIGAAVCGAIIYLMVIPHLTDYLVRQDSMLEKNVMPWLVMIWVSAIPCYAVLFLGWLVSDNIGKDRSFCDANAKYLKWMSYMAMIDVIYFFAVNGIFLVNDMSHPFVMGIVLLICFVGTAFSVCAAALSHLVMKASEIQEENELTI